MLSRLGDAGHTLLYGLTADRPSAGQAARPAAPPRGPAAMVTAPARLTAEVVLALPYVVQQVPPLVRDARVLVGELTRLARGRETGALNDLVVEAARLVAAEADAREPRRGRSDDVSAQRAAAARGGGRCPPARAAASPREATSGHGAPEGPRRAAR